MKHVVLLKHPAVPGGSLRSRGQIGICRCTGPKEGAVPAMEVDRGEVKLVGIPHADEPGPIETLVSDSRSEEPRASLRNLNIRSSLSQIAKGTNALPTDVP